jgi:hypothetical protein
MNLLAYINPWLYRCRKELERVNAQLAKSDNVLDEEKRRKLEQYDQFTKRVQIMAVEANKMTVDLSQARELTGVLIREKQDLINEHAATINRITKELDDLRSEHRKKLDQMNLMAKQLARLRVWILRTHRVDLSSFMALETVEK